MQILTAYPDEWPSISYYSFSHDTDIDYPFSCCVAIFN